MWFYDCFKRLVKKGGVVPLEWRREEQRGCGYEGIGKGESARRVYI